MDVLQLSGVHQAVKESDDFFVNERNENSVKTEEGAGWSGRGGLGKPPFTSNRRHKFPSLADSSNTSHKYNQPQRLDTKSDVENNHI